MAAEKMWLDRKLSTEPMKMMVMKSSQKFDLPAVDIAYLKHPLTEVDCVEPDGSVSNKFVWELNQWSLCYLIHPLGRDNGGEEAKAEEFHDEPSGH